jgi:hypothetical protein
VFFVFEVGDGRAPAAGLRRRVRPVTYVGRAREDVLDETTLHASPLAVNDAHAAKSGAARFLQIFHHDALNVARRNRVEVENVCYLKANGFGKKVEVVAIFTVAVVAIIYVYGRRGVRVRSLVLINLGCARGGARSKPPAAEPSEKRETHSLEIIKCLPQASLAAIMLPFKKLNSSPNLPRRNAGVKAACLFSA